MNLQRFRTPIRTLLLGVFVLRLTVLGGQSLAQANQASTNGPLKAFVGTWEARAPGEKTPFLVVNLHESNGKLSGTMSHFKIAVVGSGRVIGTPARPGESPIADLTVRNGDLSFVWGGDPPLRGGQCKFVIEGTQKASLIIFVTAQEMQEIMADNPGARGFNPVISVSREAETNFEERTEKSAQKWEAASMARLINTAEVQYEFANGSYANYATLLHSGQLKETGEREFTVLPGNWQSETNPLPGYRFRLLISADGSSYQLSIQERTADCGTGLFSDETGIVFEGRASDCQAR